MLRISATGHRPPKLGGYEPCEKHRAIRRHMRAVLQKLQDQYKDLTLYSGGANGIDQFWMEVGHYLKLPVVAILPFPSFSSLWPQSGQDHLKELLDKCQEVRYTHGDSEITSKVQAAQAMISRDKELVDACDLLVAYWDGTRGGTAHTVEFARQAKRDIYIFNPNDDLSDIFRYV